MHEICELDDPVLLDGGYIPDEAFHVRHPFERHLQVSLEPRDEDAASKHVTEEEGEEAVGTRYDTSIPTKSATSKSHTNFSGLHSEGVHKDPVGPTIVSEHRVDKPVTDAHPDTGVHLLAPFNSITAACSRARDSSIARLFVSCCSVVIRVG
ncbi:hypothetical protein CRM22_005999 [Opisthorchis felineus]|uniref:Uncharacterized protein n=1 Tax=Opisthorchis felineus TaxID=147828 RepID=A0A4S2LVM9_OPIFE|nr:hypothetical protein CRM22_005999 [Opisthorchis felineus]